MTRAEFIQRLVLDAICDDYENVDQVILRQVAETGATCGVAIERADVVAALGALVDAGLARAYELSRVEPFSREIAGMPSLEVPEEDFRTYFYPTEQGLEFQKGDGTWWPFDEDGTVRPDWKAPTS